jgi:hypothetical protein
MNFSPASNALLVDSGPSHAEISQCASELWTESGRPENQDEAIWLEAERRLISARISQVTPTIIARSRPLQRTTVRAAGPRSGGILL